MSKGSFSSIGVSVGVHIVLLGALAMIQMNLLDDQPDVIVETVFDDERQQEEFTKELETETEISETKNIQTGGVVSTQVGGSGAPAVQQTKIDQSETLQDPQIKVNIGSIDLPGEDSLSNDLGVGAVTGATGEMVEGYGAALSRLTQELIRLMRQQKVLVVWLFDESESMKDDQKELAQKFHKVYEELGIQQKTDKELKKSQEVLWTSILGFGSKVNTLTPKPTAKVNEIRAAIDKIAVDETGEENMCQSISWVLDNFGTLANRSKRRLVIVVVSDESPSDDTKVEDAITKSQRFNAPVYILGREAIFGYPYARYRWVDPEFGLTHWVWIDRGPETAFPECLQYDGLHARHDSFPSGFGPYSQVRIVKETGGIYFVLPGEEQNLTGAGANDKRKFDSLAMKEYTPLLLPRREYEASRNASKFRSKIWDIIVMLNPHIHKELNISHWHYPIELEAFRARGIQDVAKAVNAFTKLGQSLDMLEAIRPLRDKESSQRWRANYDLIVAQCLTYRVRLFQFMLAMDQHGRDFPKPSDPKHNRWHVSYRKEKMVPDDEQFRRMKGFFKIKESREEFLKTLQDAEDRSNQLYAFVESEHPGTPWARRVAYERSLGYGMKFHSSFWDPRYANLGKKIKVPKF